MEHKTVALLPRPLPILLLGEVTPSLHLSSL